MKDCTRAKLSEGEKLQNLITEAAIENVNETLVLSLPLPRPSQDLILMENMTAQNYPLKSIMDATLTPTDFSSCFCKCGMSTELAPYSHRNGSKIWHQSKGLNIQKHLLQNFIYLWRRKRRRNTAPGAIWPLSRCLCSLESPNKWRLPGGSSKASVWLKIALLIHMC